MALVHAAACGTVLTLLATAAPDPAVSGLAREAVLAAVIADVPRSRRRARSGPPSRCGRPWPTPTPSRPGSAGCWRSGWTASRPPPPLSPAFHDASPA